MKTNEVKKIFSTPAAELRKNIVEAREKLWEMKRDIASGKLKNPYAAIELRRTIARMLTALNTTSTESH